MTPVSPRPVVFLNRRQVATGAIDGMPLPRDYVLACRFLRCGIIDRTGTLDLGFASTVLDPIPPPAETGAFSGLCDARGAEIVAEACEAKREIAVLWSGGIDSTTALIAMMKAAERQGCRDRVRIVLSLHSVQEYPAFFFRFIDGRYRIQPVSAPIAAALDSSDLNVTGEHGDQIFGSHLLESYVRRGVGQEPYRAMLPLVLLEQLRNPLHARRARRYLEPAIAAAPVPIHSLFDCMWWLNFALKWQEVTLRLAIPRGGEAGVVHGSFRHFFRDRRFQAWALMNGASRHAAAWVDYKEPAKRYILDFTGDVGYYRTKEKEDSLRNVIAGPEGSLGYRALMRDDFRPVVHPIELAPTSSWWRRLGVPA